MPVPTKNAPPSGSNNNPGQSSGSVGSGSQPNRHGSKTRGELAADFVAAISSGKTLFDERIQQEHADEVERVRKLRERKIEEELSHEVTSSNIIEAIPGKILNALATNSHLLITEVSLSAPSEELTGTARKVYDKLMVLGLKPGVVHYNEGDYWTFMVKKEKLFAAVDRLVSLSGSK
jgi:hypothetical protein